MKINVTAIMKNYIIIAAVIAVVIASEQCSEESKKVCGSYPPSCKKSKYRSYDGSCNNLKHPSWGSANKEYDRFIPAFYDGKHGFPRSVTGKPLMNPRDVSLKVFPGLFCEDQEWSLLTMQWGQIVAHDMSLTKDVPQTSESLIVCCTNGEPIPKQTNPRCKPIPLPKDDPYNAPEGYTCIDFYRTGSNADKNCSVPGKIIEPLSEVTSFLDLSIVYGNDDQRANEIRTHFGGQLISVDRNGQSWPPQNPNSTFACDNTMNAQEPCYYSGDIRVNQNPELAMLQVLLLRQHNLIAKQLCDVINPHWSDERCFQEARKIMIAIAQKITYYDFLYIFIGLKNMEEEGLIYPNAKEFIDDYNPTVNPQILNEHATAAWRFFHSLIAGFLQKFSPARHSTGQIRLSDWFNRPSVIEDDNNFCELSIGLATQPQSRADRFFDPEITQNFFKPLNSCTGGQDLRAIDIQRARDHGVGKYVDARAACGFGRPRCFADLEKDMTRDRVKLLQRVYKSVCDVELAVGAALEKPVNGTITPPTFLCIIKKQFKRTRVGDRFFFENGGKDTGFTIDQLNSIRKFTIARLLCDTVKCITRIQKDAFSKISEKKFSPARHSTGQIRLSDWFNRPSVIEDDNNFCELSIGLATQPQSRADRFFDPEITQNFFKPLNSCTGGQDLRAIDIQRARDHGVGKYVDARAACGFGRPRCFADLEKDMTRDRVKLLQRVYKSVCDVELAVGAALEKPVNGTITPPTFLCIIKKQFKRTRVGDRFFFENGGKDTGFTIDQLNSIRKFTIARLLCDTVKCITRIQKDAFSKISEKNPLVDCESLPQIDFSLWKEVP